MYECTDDNGVLSEPPPAKESPQKITTDHLLKIDVPLVTQEYRESGRHYIVAQSEKVLDPNGYMRMKTKVEHYLYTLNTSNDIGKPVLSDVVRFPQDVLTMFNKQNNFSKEDDSQESVSELINNCFKDLQVKTKIIPRRSGIKQKSLASLVTRKFLAKRK
ncbi:uncharacterized protein isoform X2 [Rhodnius prolixus]|uniref:uncharacterized protein isoform X2 n=1 Tax=Rhodnius prolixus TaxID=13249 RepID=UPI003D18A951